MRRFLIDLAILILVLIISIPFIRPKAAILLNNRGTQYFKEKDWDRALVFFRRSLALNPNSTVHRNLARVYKEKGMLKSSIREYEKAIGLNPKYVQAHYELSDIYKKMDRFEEALHYFEKARSMENGRGDQGNEELRLSYAIALLNEAIDSYGKGDLHVASAKLHKAIELKNDFAFAYKMLGDICMNQNNLQEAISHYKRVLECGIKDPQVYNNIGLGYMFQEKYKEAAGYLRQAYGLQPSNRDILYNLASILRDHKEYDEALKLYKKLAEMEYDYHNVHNDMAGIYEMMNQQEKARSEYGIEADIDKNKLKKNPANIVVMNSLATAYSGLGKQREAEDIINRVIGRNPDYREAYHTRSIIHEKLGENEKAARDIKEAKRLLPKQQFIGYTSLPLEKNHAPVEDIESMEKIK